MRVPLLALLAAGAILSGCLGSAPAAQTPATNATAPAMAPMPSTATVELGENPSAPGAPAFGPGSMYLKATGMDALVVGMPVNLTIKNAGADVHDLVIDGEGFKSGDIAAGATKTFTFTPTKDGSYPMYCDKGFSDPAGANVATHRGAGMEGKVTVKKA